MLLTAVIVAGLVHASLLAAARRALRGRRPYLLSILNGTKNLTRFGLLLLATIGLIGWIASTALELGATLYLRVSASTPTTTCWRAST